MLKKCLVAIALTAFLAVTVQAAVIDFGCSGIKGLKGDPWPCEYKKVEICRIPLLMEVGYYVEVDGCDDAEILLEQLPCPDIGKEIPDDWPCYQGCTKISVRSNFEVEMSGSVSHSGTSMSHNDGEFNGSKEKTFPGDGLWHEVTVCVNAYKVKLMDMTPGTEPVEIGYLKVNVRPTANPCP